METTLQELADHAHREFGHAKQVAVLRWPSSRVYLGFVKKAAQEAGLTDLVKEIESWENGSALVALFGDPNAQPAAIGAMNARQLPQESEIETLFGRQFCLHVEILAQCNSEGVSKNEPIGWQLPNWDRLDDLPIVVGEGQFPHNPGFFLGEIDICERHLVSCSLGENEELPASVETLPRKIGG